jgi:hypothetical protein
MPMRFEQVFESFVWRPIPRCPGRYVLKGGVSDRAIVDIVGQGALISEHHVSTARDLVVVAGIEDGGLISYRKASGKYLHTLNDPDGFARKLADLGIESIWNNRHSGDRQKKPH